MSLALRCSCIGSGVSTGNSASHSFRTRNILGRWLSHRDHAYGDQGEYLDVRAAMTSVNEPTPVLPLRAAIKETNSSLVVA